MKSVRDEVNEVIKILNRKNWTKEEAKKIEDMFKAIEDAMEHLKEEAWGEDR